MAQILHPPPVLLFWSVLVQSNEVSLETLRQSFEIICAPAPVLIFQHDYFPMKSYYSAEMGDESSLKRYFFFKMAPFQRQDLVQAKKQAMLFEDCASKDGRRLINIDPGTLGLDNVVLSTAKPYAHRIYHCDGIYSELCLLFKDENFHPVDWTYPDYRDQQVLEFFRFMRSFLKQQTPAWINRLL